MSISTTWDNLTNKMAAYRLDFLFICKNILYYTMTLAEYGSNIGFLIHVSYTFALVSYSKNQSG